jgi:hypothetical protein
MRFALHTLLLSAFLIPIGCSAAPPPEGLLSYVEDARLNEIQLRERVNDVARRFAAEVESAAAEIVQRSTDPTIERAARRWCVNAVRACYLAAFRLDPAIALIDLRALTEQQTAFFATGAGVGLFETHQDIALEACRRLERVVGDAVAEVVPEASADREYATILAEWPERQPIESLEFSRSWPPDTMEFLIDRTGQGTFGAVRSLDAQVFAMIQLLPTQLSGMLDQLRWEAELVIGDTVSRSEVAVVREDLHALTEDLDAFAPQVAEITRTMTAMEASIERIPTSLAEESRKLTAEFEAQRVAVTDSLDEQFERLTDAVESQRTQLVVALDRQLSTVTGEFDRQRRELVTALGAERELVLREIEVLRQHTIEDLEQRSQDSVRAWIRYFFLVFSVMLAAFAVAGTLLVVMLRRRAAGLGSRPA